MEGVILFFLRMKILNVIVGTSVYLLHNRRQECSANDFCKPWFAHKDKVGKASATYSIVDAIVALIS